MTIMGDTLSTPSPRRNSFAIQKPAKKRLKGLYCAHFPQVLFFSQTSKKLFQNNFSRAQLFKGWITLCTGLIKTYCAISGISDLYLQSWTKLLRHFANFHKFLLPYENKAW